MEYEKIQNIFSTKLIVLVNVWLNTHKTTCKEDFIYRILKICPENI